MKRTVLTLVGAAIVTMNLLKRSAGEAAVEKVRKSNFMNRCCSVGNAVFNTSNASEAAEAIKAMHWFSDVPTQTLAVWLKAELDGLTADDNPNKDFQIHEVELDACGCQSCDDHQSGECPGKDGDDDSCPKDNGND